MNIRRIFALILALCLLITALPLSAQAAYKNMKFSNQVIEFIKKCEGFTKVATWDYQHYSIGYGCSCQADDYPDGITKKEADALLRVFVSESAATVNKFCKTNGIRPKQCQFDCMVSLTFALGPGWMDSCYDLPKLMIKGCSELELLNTMGDWIHAGGKPLEGLMNRRMRETYMYFHGKYNHSGNIVNDVPYAAVWFDAAGGKAEYSKLYTFRGQRYTALKSLPTAKRRGYRFLGWYDSDGNQITGDTVASGYLIKAVAHWAALPAEEQEHLFTDVCDSDWFYADVKNATDMGFFAGYSDGSFRPNEEMTRAMFAQVLYRIEGTPAVESGVPFEDVGQKSWYYQAVCWAYSTGIVKGISETAFGPNEPITREQMATMLFNFTSRHGAADSSLSESLNAFADADSVSKFARTPMKWAVGAGLIKGTGGKKLSPQLIATRAQAAAILVRMSKLVRKSVA